MNPEVKQRKAFVTSSERSFFRSKQKSREQVYDHNFWGDHDGFFWAWAEDPKDPINGAGANVIKEGEEYYVSFHIHPEAGWRVKDNGGVNKPQSRYLTPDNPVVVYRSGGLFRRKEVKFTLE